MMIPLLMMNQGHDENKIHKLINTVLMIFASAFMGLLMRYINTYSFSSTFSLFTRYNKVYHIKATITFKNNTYYSANIPIEYKALMTYLFTKITQDKTTNVKYKIYNELTVHNLKIVIFHNENTSYYVTNHIRLSHKHKSIKSDKDEFRYDTYDIQLVADDNDIMPVIEFIRETVNSYDELQLKHMPFTKTYILHNFDKQDNNAIYNEMDFRSTKTFNNMFFEDKKLLLRKLDNFEQYNKEQYNRLGLPHTLGILFHGEPGTGKTSAIKAIANYTQRHIVLINMRKINTIEKLIRLFLSERINDTKIPMNKRLYVFEEIDCSAWRNIVTSRKIKQEFETSSNTNKIDTIKIDELTECLKSVLIEKHDMTENKPEKNDITLGDFLELLDGIIEMPGRMIIMTSNHPEILDSALLRPGRIDMQIEFKCLTRGCINDMYQLWFNKNIPVDTLNKIKDYKFTQAQIGNIFSSNDEEYILDALTTNK